MLKVCFLNFLKSLYIAIVTVHDDPLELCAHPKTSLTLIISYATLQLFNARTYFSASDAAVARVQQKAAAAST